jgi:hypothetical protein
VSLFALQGEAYATPPLQKFIANEESAMDEYLFIELAKLQADRRRLEREQRQQQQQLFDSDSRPSIEGHREPLRRQWFANWSKQS